MVLYNTVKFYINLSWFVPNSSSMAFLIVYFVSVPTSTTYVYNDIAQECWVVYINTNTHFCYFHVQRTI